MIGRTVSQYRIVEELGRGGMGVAYLGRDVRLRRPVVLKFLAARLGSEEHARRRFEREARAASSLDHPHICTIYEIDETEDGQQFIAMAYYPGESLEDRLLRGPLPAADAVELASQIASGLGRAHSRGLVHRDVKPGNILISDEGEAKILDFGLARIAGEGGESGELPVGTPAYMAPEQLRGEPVDERSDQWALGALVYEMLVGEPPFTGDKLPALMHAVVSAEAEPPSEVTSSVPPALDPVVMRALSKDPEARHGDVETFARELRRAFGLSSATFGGLPEGPPPPKPSPWRSLAWLGAGALGATLLATALWTLRRPETVPPPVPSIVRTQPLARESGLETAPAWGPGGRLLAYGSDQDGNMDVWLRQRSSGTTRNLTGDHPGFDGNPVISPDGERVAFVSDRGGGGIYSISVLGGPAVEIAPVRLLPSTEARIWIPSLAFSPDGSVLAHSGTFLDPGLFLVDAEGGEPRRIELVDDGSATQPSWSPDGGRLAYASVTGTGTSVASLWTLPVAGGTPTRLTRGTSLDIQPVWSSEGDRIYFLSDRGGSSDVWWLEVDADGAPASEPRALTSGIGIGGFALSGDGGSLAYAEVTEQSNVFTIGLDGDLPVDPDLARAVTSQNQRVEFVAVSPDGQWLAFDSDRAGNMDLWIVERSGGEPRRLTDDPAHDWRPSFSPDGSHLVFHSMRSGNRDLWVVPASGGPPRQLTDHPARDAIPSWSPDGRWVAFESVRGDGASDIWIVPPEGGDALPLTLDPEADFYVVWWPDAGSVVFASQRDQGTDLYRCDVPFDSPADAPGPAGAGACAPERLTSVRWPALLPFAISEDGRYAYVQGRDTESAPTRLWRFDLDVGGVQPLVTEGKASSETFPSLAVHGQSLYFARWRLDGDLWLAELGDGRAAPR